MSKKWFVVTCKPKQENVALKSLRTLSSSIKIFSPTIRYFKLKENKKKELVHEALFPGYIFANFSLHEYYKQVDYSYGVRSILRTGSNFASLTDQGIQKIRQQTNKEDILEIKEPEIQTGDSVWVVEGPIAGTEAIIKKVCNGKERALILLKFLGQNLEVTMDLKKLLLKKS